MEQTSLPTQTAAPAQVAGRMTMALRAAHLPAMAGPRVLRIAVIQDSKVVEERIIRQRESVWVGRSEKCHIALAAPDLPPKFRHQLFELRGDCYYLVPAEGMEGRIVTKGGAASVADVRASRDGSLALDDAARGKITIGAVTLLFQLVVPPPLQPRPQLPAAARGAALRSVDWLFASIVLSSFALHFGFVSWLGGRDWPVQAPWEIEPDRFVTEGFQLTPPELPRTPDDGSEPADPERVVETASPRTTATRPPVSRPPSGPARPTLAPDFSNVGVVAILTSLRRDGSPVADVLRPGHVSGDLDEIMAQVHGIEPPSDGRPALHTRDGGTGEVRSIAALDVSARDAEIHTDDREPEREIAVRVTRPGGGTPIGGGGTLLGSDVRRVVNQAMGGIKRCYERQIRNDRNLRGRLTVTFTVAGSGAVASASAADAFDPTVGSCVVGVFRRLRFPEPEGGSVTFAFPFLFEPAH